MDALDVINSNSPQEAIEKVQNIALEKAIIKLVGSGSAVTAVQLVNGYYKNTTRGSAELSQAWYKEYLYNNNMYRVTGNEMYMKGAAEAMKMFKAESNNFLRNLNEK